MPSIPPSHFLAIFLLSITYAFLHLFTWYHYLDHKKQIRDLQHDVRKQMFSLERLSMRIEEFRRRGSREDVAPSSHRVPARRGNTRTNRGEPPAYVQHPGGRRNVATQTQAPLPSRIPVPVHRRADNTLLTCDQIMSVISGNHRQLLIVQHPLFVDQSLRVTLSSLSPHER
ncbi:hypothetical protein BDV95DRAFT_597597 [Massariosphaeria phaeospora]|uniref:Uncharacterized protein n=1 Tax=Massariosphaeria phaeospora TaxID=100035 RepID=A0A7C8MIC4_9PLEO|nr:hypothetical protein BDV95DRAFT_597597 [Massariosphaeria phaeospora]